VHTHQNWLAARALPQNRQWAHTVVKVRDDWEGWSTLLFGLLELVNLVLPCSTPSSGEWMLITLAKEERFVKILD